MRATADEPARVVMSGFGGRASATQLEKAKEAGRAHLDTLGRRGWF